MKNIWLVCKKLRSSNNVLTLFQVLLLSLFAFLKMAIWIHIFENDPFGQMPPHKCIYSRKNWRKHGETHKVSWPLQLSISHFSKIRCCHNFPHWACFALLGCFHNNMIQVNYLKPFFVPFIFIWIIMFVPFIFTKPHKFIDLCRNNFCTSAKFLIR